MIRMFIVVALLWSTLPSIAQACACCDGSSRRAILGWTDRGAALVEHTGIVSCDDIRAYEVWRAGTTRPAGCFDLYSATPTSRVRCDGLTTGFDAEQRVGTPMDDEALRAGITAQLARRRAAFARPVRVVRARDVRAELSRLREAEQGGTDARLIVKVRGADGTFVEVLRRPVLLTGSEYDDMGEAMNEAVVEPIEVSVFPDPSGARALVRVSGHNTAPGMGYFPTELFPARLPAMAPAALVSETPDVLAVPPLGGSAISANGGRYSNRRALHWHQRGHFETSARLFAAAITQDPTNPRYRVNLACAYARQGEADRALVILEDLQARRGDCSRCAAALAAARSDDDFASLRSNARFQRATAGGTNTSNGSD